MLEAGKIETLYIAEVVGTGYWFFPWIHNLSLDRAAQRFPVIGVRDTLAL